MKPSLGKSMYFWYLLLSNCFWPTQKYKKLTAQLIGQETDQNHMDVPNKSWLFFQKLYNSSCISYSILTAGMVHYSELGIFIIIHTVLFEKKRAFKRTLKGFKLHQAKNTLLACPSNWSSYEKVYFQEELGRQHKKNPRIF